MAYPVYSTRLYAGVLQVAAGAVRLFTTPAGHRVVVHYLNWQQTATTNAQLVLTLGPGMPQLGAFPAVTAQIGVREQTGIVLHEGESCYGQAYVNAGTLSLYGYLFTGSGGPLVPGQLPARPA